MYTRHIEFYLFWTAHSYSCLEPDPQWLFLPQAPEERRHLQVFAFVSRYWQLSGHEKCWLIPPPWMLTVPVSLPPAGFFLILIMLHPPKVTSKKIRSYTILLTKLNWSNLQRQTYTNDYKTRNKLIITKLKKPTFEVWFTWTYKVCQIVQVMKID